MLCQCGLHAGSVQPLTILIYLQSSPLAHVYDTYIYIYHNDFNILQLIHSKFKLHSITFNRNVTFES